MSTQRIWLYCHGPAQVEPNTCIGWTDVPLADRAQAKIDALHLAKRIGHAHTIWTSDLRRARQAARPLARALGARVQVSPALREINFGDWEGQTWPKIRRDDPEQYQAYIDDWSTTTMPGGESYSDLKRRVVGWWTQREIDGPMIIVGHSIALRALAGHLINWKLADEMAVTLASGHFARIDPSSDERPLWNVNPASAMGRNLG